ncbi:MAG: hypothetical protein SGPRY_008454 [Prymnesium sp.]
MCTPLPSPDVRPIPKSFLALSRHRAPPLQGSHTRGAQGVGRAQLPLQQLSPPRSLNDGSSSSELMILIVIVEIIMIVIILMCFIMIGMVVISIVSLVIAILVLTVTAPISVNITVGVALARGAAQSRSVFSLRPADREVCAAELAPCVALQQKRGVPLHRLAGKPRQLASHSLPLHALQRGGGGERVEGGVCLRLEELGLQLAEL